MENWIGYLTKALIIFIQANIKKPRETISKGLRLGVVSTTPFFYLTYIALSILTMSFVMDCFRGFYQKKFATLTT